MSEPVVISDVRIPFGRMVLIILKWMLASIPAMLLMWGVMFFIILAFGVFGGFLAAFMPTP
jgi:hypothetical protein